MVVSVVGLGLIGGSVALDLKARGFTRKIIGVEQNPQHAGLALKRGIADEIALTLPDAVAAANLVILAVPVNQIIALLPQVLTLAGTKTVVTDMGSTKLGVVQSVANHPNRQAYVAAHPMAGTEFSGPTAALYNLFDRKVAIICNKESSHYEALTIVESMFRTLNMPLLYMDAAEHDMHAAYVSHISHITSFVLANTVLQKEKSVSTIFNLASGGFASTVRLAKSSPATWSQIFEQNTNNVLEVLDTYIDNLNQWRYCLQNGNFTQLAQLMQEANAISKILDK
ncbi:prephenate dehydrogenase [Sphingobacteriales bacterium UPWRP_1]|nr:prephenate dehydrogenase [Sphingobacteriales bacterium TSM_CSM]PSJ77442.1 prephenate dehydrogenase [Sphingobacteriales bacterium UPWRP_1]